MRGCSTIAPTPSAPPGGDAIQVIYAWNPGGGDNYDESVEKIARIVDRLDWMLDEASDHDQHLRLSCSYTPNGSYGDYARALVASEEIEAHPASSTPSAHVRNDIQLAGYNDANRLYLVFTDFESESDAVCAGVACHGGSAVVELWDSGVAGHELFHLLMCCEHAWYGEGGAPLCGDIMAAASPGCGWDHWWALDHDYNSYYDPTELAATFDSTPPAASPRPESNIATSPFLTVPTCCDAGASSDILTKNQRTVESGSPGGAAPAEYTTVGLASLATTPSCGPVDVSCFFYDGRKSLLVNAAGWLSGFSFFLPVLLPPAGVRLTTPPSVVGRRTYTFSAATRGTGFGSLRLQLRWFDATGGTISQNITSFALSSSWQKRSITAKAPPAAATVSAEILWSGPFDTTFHVDALQLAYQHTDGRTDLLDFEEDGSGTGDWITLRNNGDGTFTWASFAEEGVTAPRKTVRLDYDNDGFPDVLSFEGYGSGHWMRLRNDGDGGFSATGAATAGAVAEPVHALTLDYNRDGYDDLLDFELDPGSSTSGGWKRLRNNGNGMFLPDGSAVGGLTKPEHAVAFDYDGDGHTDVLQFEEANAGSWAMLHNNGDGTFTFAGFAVQFKLTPHHVVTLDYDADGDTDLLSFEHTPPMAGGAWVKLRNDGGGTFSNDGDAVTGMTNPAKAVLLDYDSDGRLDLLDFETGSAGGSWVKLRNLGGGTFTFDGFAVTGLATPSQAVAMDWGG